MTTTVRSSFHPTKTRLLTVALFLAILFGCYGLLSAQQARSAPAPAKNVWGGIRDDGTIAFQKHITGVVHSGTGVYAVTFDRHVDNCSIQVTSRFEGNSVNFGSFMIGPGSSTSEVIVTEADVDGDFDISGKCPST
jgi:hypothetical protein